MLFLFMQMLAHRLRHAVISDLLFAMSQACSALRGRTVSVDSEPDDWQDADVVTRCHSSVKLPLYSTYITSRSQVGLYGGFQGVLVQYQPLSSIISMLLIAAIPFGDVVCYPDYSTKNAKSKSR